MTEFGKFLRNKRLALGMSQHRLSQLAGIDSSHLSRIERGKKAPPKRATVERLAKALKLDSGDRKALFVLGGYAVPSEPIVLGFASSLVDTESTDNPSLAERVAQLDKPAKDVVKETVDLLTSTKISKVQRKALTRNIVTMVRSFGILVNLKRTSD